jgi:uncharacterized membrane protein YphA (DoxX/SURF4 family)
VNPLKQRLSTAQPWLAVAGRIGLAAVFLISGWTKVTDLEDTVRSVRAYRILPEVLVRPFAYGLPLVEFSVAAILLLGIGTRFAALLTAALMVMFMYGVSQAWIRGLKIDCGCFGSHGGEVPDPVPGYITTLLRDTGLLLVALALARWSRSRLSLDGMLGVHYERDRHPVRSGR